MQHPRHSGPESDAFMTQQPEAEVHFVRSTQGFPRSALDRAAAAKLRLEHNYKVSLQQAIERNQR